MTNSAPRGLGRGLSALISENYVQANAQDTHAIGIDAIRQAHITKLHSGTYQPRRKFDNEKLMELADSIRSNGIMQPIIVRNGKDNTYEIIAGERRWRAAKMAGLQSVPVIVRDISDKQALELALIENIQRHDLSPLEEAVGYQRLIAEFEYTQEALASIIGKSRSHVANLLRLLGLPDEVKTMLDKGELTMGHARALLTAPNPLELAQNIVEKGLNVRQAEQAGREVQGREKKTIARAGSPARRMPAFHKDPDIIALEETLSENLGLTVSITDQGQSGQIVITYTSLSELDSILQRLGDNNNI